MSRQAFINFVGAITAALWGYILLHGARLYFGIPPLSLCASGEEAPVCTRLWLGALALLLSV